jgi:hypothetical protein
METGWPLASISTVLEGFAVMLTSVGICGAAGIFGAVVEGKSTEEITRWGYWGTAVGFALGVPLTICAFVLIGRSS